MCVISSSRQSVWLIEQSCQIPLNNLDEELDKLFSSEVLYSEFISMLSVDVNLYIYIATLYSYIIIYINVLNLELDLHDPN